MPIITTDVARPRPSGTIPSLSQFACGDLIASSATAGSTTWPTANLAMFAPFYLSYPETIVKISWLNGTVASGNIDVGVYNFAGTRLVSAGTTAQTGTSQIQTADVTDTNLQPGVYFMAIALDNTTGTIYRVAPGNVWLRAMGMQEMASAFVLPSTATFANPTNSFAPIMALQLQTTI